MFIHAISQVCRVTDPAIHLRAQVKDLRQPCFT